MLTSSRVFVVLAWCCVVILSDAQKAMGPDVAAPPLPASAAAAAILAPLLTSIPEGVTLNARTVQSPALSPAATAPLASPGLPCPGSEQVLLNYGRYIQSQNASGALKLVAYTNAPAGISFYTCPGNFSGVYCSGKAWLTSAGTDLACIVADLITPDALDSPYQPTPVLGTGIVCEYSPQGIIAFADALPDSSVTYMSSRGAWQNTPLPYHDTCKTDADCPDVLANYLCNAGQCQLPLPSSCFAVK